MAGSRRDVLPVVRDDVETWVEHTRRSDTEGTLTGVESVSVDYRDRVAIVDASIPARDRSDPNI